jgi:bifunctional ADP-heptose synthase (sugar kinase/adenylyltransferase)
MTSAVERAEFLAALACVDYVVVCDEETRLSAVERLQPDVDWHDADYPLLNRKPMSDADVFNGYGDPISYLARVPEIATADVENCIQDEKPPSADAHMGGA